MAAFQAPKPINMAIIAYLSVAKTGDSLRDIDYLSPFDLYLNPPSRERWNWAFVGRFSQIEHEANRPKYSVTQKFRPVKGTNCGVVLQMKV